MSNYEQEIIEKYGYVIHRKDAAELLKVSLPTIDRFLRNNTLKYKKIGHAVAITPKTIVEFLGLE